MNTPIEYDALPVTAPQPAQKPGSPQPFFPAVWRALVRAMTPSTDPVVRQTVNRRGQTTGWHLYDPSSGQSLSFGSEQEVRLWLEARYR